MNFNNYFLVSLLVVTIFSSTTLFSDNFFDQSHNIDKENNLSPNLLQNSYAIEEDEDDEDNDKGENEEKDFNNKKDNSIFNIVAVGDFDCNGDAEDTVENIIESKSRTSISSW